VDDRLAQFANGSNPIVAAMAGVAGGLIGGGIYLSISGVVLGTLMGLSLGGILVFLSSLFAKLTGSKSEATKSPVGTAPISVPISAGAVVSTVPAEAGIPQEVLDVTQSEAQLLAAGRFDHYHLAKAKRLFEAKNFKEAAYQCAASLSHGSLAEAANLRKTALAAIVR
jgi:hypothetical protein